MSPNYLDFNLKKKKTKKKLHGVNVASPLRRIIIGRAMDNHYNQNARRSLAIDEVINSRKYSKCYIPARQSNEEASSARFAACVPRENSTVACESPPVRVILHYERKKKGRATYGSYAGIAQGRNIPRTSCFFPRGSR